MKIPEIPGSYQPGDVVNGYVLTDRGHWVELSNDRAAGLRRRYLGTDVSTVRDPDKPSSELSGADRQAAAYTAGHSPSPPSPPPGPTYSQGPPPPPGPTHTAGHLPPPPPPPGRTSSAGPAQPPRQARAQGPSPYTAPPPGGPTSAPPQQQKKNGCAGCLVVAVVVLAVIGLIVAALTSVGDRLRADADSPGEIVWAEDELASWDEELADIDVDIPEMRQFRLDDEELALVEMEWEVFHAEHASHYVLTIGAPGLERPHANLSISVEATDEDGVLHEFTESVTLRWGTPVAAVGYFRERLESEIVDVDMTITTTFAHDGTADYTPWVETYTVDTSGIRPLLTLDLVGEGDGAPSMGRLTTVVRDEEGQIINVGSTYLALPEPGTTVTVELYLWGEEPVLDDDDVDFSISG